MATTDAMMPTDDMTTTDELTTTDAMTTTDDMTTLVDNSANNRGSSEGNYEYWLCMSNSTFSNISVISLRPCLLLEKTRVLWEINYLYLICHTHTGYLLPHNTETRSVLLSLRLPRFQSVFTSYIFFSIPVSFVSKIWTTTICQKHMSAFILK